MYPLCLCAATERINRQHKMWSEAKSKLCLIQWNTSLIIYSIWFYETNNTKTEKKKKTKTGRILWRWILQIQRQRRRRRQRKRRRWIWIWRKRRIWIRIQREIQRLQYWRMHTYNPFWKETEKVWIWIYYMELVLFYVNVCHCVCGCLWVQSSAKL